MQDSATEIDRTHPSETHESSALQSAVPTRIDASDTRRFGVPNEGQSEVENPLRSGSRCIVGANRPKHFSPIEKRATASKSRRKLCEKRGPPSQAGELLASSYQMSR
jgi:hypothetical protein